MRRNGNSDRRPKPTDEAADAVVAAGEAVLADQVLVDPLGRQVPLPGRDDHRPVRFALAGPARCPDAGAWGRNRLRLAGPAEPRGAMVAFDSAATGSEPGGAMAGI